MTQESNKVTVLSEQRHTSVANRSGLRDAIFTECFAHLLLLFLRRRSFDNLINSMSEVNNAWLARPERWSRLFWSSTVKFFLETSSIAARVFWKTKKIGWLLLKSYKYRKKKDFVPIKYTIEIYTIWRKNII